MTTGKINVSVKKTFPLKKFLYSDHEIFRELISNGTDKTVAKPIWQARIW
jgi:HSP90 family molecular chaperone